MQITYEILTERIIRNKHFSELEKVQRLHQILGYLAYLEALRAKSKKLQAFFRFYSRIVLLQ